MHWNFLCLYVTFKKVYSTIGTSSYPQMTVFWNQNAHLSLISAMLTKLRPSLPLLQLLPHFLVSWFAFQFPARTRALLWTLQWLVAYLWKPQLDGPCLGNPKTWRLRICFCPINLLDWRHTICLLCWYRDLWAHVPSTWAVHPGCMYQSWLKPRVLHLLELYYFNCWFYPWGQVMPPG